MIAFELENCAYKSGASGTWFKAMNQKRTAGIGLWLSVGLPLWLVPQIIWNQMKDKQNTLFDCGIGWLFACVRLVVCKKSN